MNRFLVTGVGHSGTGWAARLLTHLGFRCGHESIFTRSSGVEAWGEAGDSSWLAVPHLPFVEPEIPVIHVVRDPFDVVKSFLRIGAMGSVHRPFARYVAHHRPDIVAPALPVDRVIRHVLRWDEPVFDRASVTLHCGASLEELMRPVAAIAAAIGEPTPTFHALATAVESVGEETNHHEGHPDREWATHALLARPEGPKLIDRQRAISYSREAAA